MGIAASLGNQTMTADDAGITQCFFNLYTTLKAGGWRPVADSDGTTRSGTGSQLTHAGTGANGFRNTNAWWILRQPVGGTPPYSGNRTITVRRVSGSPLFEVKYSRTGNLVSVGNATTPDTMEYDAIAMEATSMYLDSTRYHIIVLDAAENFGWWLAGWVPGGTASLYSPAFFFDPVTQYVPAPIVDPYVVSFGKNENIFDTQFFGGGAMITNSVLRMNTWRDIGGPHELWGYVKGAFPGDSSGSIVNAVGVTRNDPSARIPIFPVIYGANVLYSVSTAFLQNFVNGYKGVSSLFAWTGVSSSMGTLHNSNTKIQLSQIVARWDSTITPTI